MKDDEEKARERVDDADGILDLREANAALEAEISRREIVEKQLRESKKQLTVVMDTAPDAVITADVDGVITYVNDVTETLFGYRRSELVGEPLTILMPERFRDRHEAGLDRYRTTRERHVIGRTVELAGCRKDGTEFAIELSLGVWETQDGEPAFTGVIRDITQREEQWRRLQTTSKELKAALQAAQEANEAKSRFLASMSHDIRTPMNGVIGFSELLRNTELDAVQKNYASLIHQSANSLLQLLNDILDFSKMEAGEFELDTNRFRLCDVLGDSLQMHAHRAFEKGLELTYRAPPDAAEYCLEGDRLRLRQIVDNLVGNAVKYTQEGSVSVRAEIDRIEEDVAQLHVCIEDTGPGIAEEQQERIFEAFQQAESAIAREKNGAGLGLSISARLVELMQGSLWLESTVGQGSSFHFTAALRLRHEPAISQADRDAGRGSRVLIVDDIDTNRQVFRDLIAYWEMTPIVTSSGAEALDVLRHSSDGDEPIDVILLDQLMPEMNGWEFARALAGDPDLPAIPIIILSSAGRGRLRPDRFDELGIAGVLSKPVKQLELWDAIARTLDTSDRQVDDGISTDAEPLRVLAAEDSLVNQMLIRRVMEQRGHRVTVVEDGREAVRLFEAQRFDVVLMDVEMPEMDGLEAAERIRDIEGDAGTRTPIIALTAHAMKGDRERCLQAGMDDYVSKPVQPDDLFQAIYKSLRKHEYDPP